MPIVADEYTHVIGVDTHAERTSTSSSTPAPAASLTPRRSRRALPVSLAHWLGSTVGQPPDGSRLSREPAPTEHL